MGTIRVVISSRCKNYINIYVCQKVGNAKKVVATVGAMMAVKCPRPPEASDL